MLLVYYTIMKAKILPQISLISAISRTKRTIGRDGGGLPWRIPEDFKYFREKTTGHPIIMGRKTFEEFNGKLLPNRIHIVITREKDYKAPAEVLVANSIEDAISKASQIEDKEIFVIGGAQIYEQALPFADKLYITQVDTDIDSSIKFPDYTKFGFNKIIYSQKSQDRNFSYEFQEITKTPK
jgi:dihydrofolate reductase